MILSSFNFIIFSFLFINPIHATDNGCIADLANPPCHPAPGRCTTNSNDSHGGFVAETATVESVIINGLKRNKPFIGLHTSICETAHVAGNTRIDGNAQISGTAWVFGDAHIFENAQVIGTARVYGSVKVYGNAQIFGSARLFGNTHVYQDAKVYGDAYVGGNAKISGNDMISTGDYGF